MDNREIGIGKEICMPAWTGIGMSARHITLIQRYRPPLSPPSAVSDFINWEWSLPVATRFPSPARHHVLILIYLPNN